MRVSARIGGAVLFPFAHVDSFAPA